VFFIFSTIRDRLSWFMPSRKKAGRYKRRMFFWLKDGWMIGSDGILKGGE